MTAPMILPHMDLSAVIQPGMNMVLTVLILKATITGIAQAATAQVMVTLYVAMVHVMAMKPMKLVQMIVMLLANEMLVI